jgi:putative transcriptional regulator
MKPKGTKGGHKHSVVGASIARGLNEAIAWAKGEEVHAKQHTIHVPVIDVRQVRKSLNLTQTGFSLKYGFPIATLRNWEQGRREPELPAKILLAVIAKRPDVVEEVLAE